MGAQALGRSTGPSNAYSQGEDGCSVTLVRCPDGHIFFACVRCFCPGKERNGCSVTLPA